jgi:hypothetical protein
MEGITMTQKTKHDRKPSVEVADILREHIVNYQQNHSLFHEHYKIVYDILNCRTAYLGGRLSMTCSIAEQPILVVIFNSASIVAPNVLCIIHAAIATAPSVRIYHGKGGLKLEGQSSSRLFTFITYLPCPTS